MITTRSKLFIPVLSITALVSTLALAGCTDTASTVNVTLREYSVTPDTSSVPAGTVTFHVSNAGTMTHEFLVIKTDLAANALPRLANGSYQEDGAGTSLVDEIETLAAGQTRDLVLDLSAGNYVLICNMVMPAGAHDALGMRAAFRVD